MSKLSAAERRESVIFDMRGGPWDGRLIRVFRPDWDTFDWPEQKGMYVRPQTSDPLMVKAKANKKRTNVPWMSWESYG